MPQALRRAIRNPHTRGVGSISDLPLLSDEEPYDGHGRTSILTEGGFTPPASSKADAFRFNISDGELPQSHEGVRLDNSGLYFNWCLFAITTLSCVATTYYAYNASITNPNQNFIPSNPQWTLGILNTMTTLSAFLLGELVQAIFERLRWIFASRPQGVQMGDFLGMSRATSIAGVLALFWGTTRISDTKPSRMRKWIAQRIIALAMTAFIRLILLYHVSATQNYPTFVTQSVFSGMTTFNASATLKQSTPDFIRRIVIQDFILAPLAPYRITFPQKSIACKDPACVAVRIHDNIEYTIVAPSNFSANEPVPTYLSSWKSEFDPSHDWTVFKVDGATTIQLEFSTLDVDYVFDPGDCQIYGYPYLALQICLAQGSAAHTVFLATSACVRIDQVDCFTNQTWTTSQPSVNASAWSQNTTIAYDRKDGNILESLPTSNPIPSPIDIESLGLIYEAFYGKANFSDSSGRTDNITATIRYHTVEQATEWIQGDVGIRGAGGDDDHYWTTLAVRSLLVVPLTDFTNPKTAEQLVQGSSAVQFDRLIIQLPSLYGFALIVITLLGWSAFCLTIISTSAAPNSSLFPEVDFGSKCEMPEDILFEREAMELGETKTMGQILFPLSNASNKIIIRHISATTIYVGSVRRSPQALPHVILATAREGLDELRLGEYYE